MLSAENERPYDRPNLSKDYLADNAPGEWLPLRPTEFYPEHEIVLALGARAVPIDAETREIQPPVTASSSGRQSRTNSRPA